MSKITLYGIDASAPVRACLLTLKALQIPFEYKIVNTLKGEQLSKEFLKLNPQHTVPVLDDNGIVMWDSHAICAYLVDKYGKTDSLYPKDLAKRVMVNQRLFFDTGVLYPALINVSRPLFRKNITEVPSEKVQNILDAYEFVETFLADHSHLAGEELTIADFSCGATVTSLLGIVEIKDEKFPKTKVWLNRLFQLPFYEEANGKGVKEYTDYLKLKLTFV